MQLLDPPTFRSVQEGHILIGDLTLGADCGSNNLL